MSTFKDLLSKDFQNQLKTLSQKPTPKTVANTQDKLNTQAQAQNDDTTLFMQAMSGVKPLKYEESISHRKKTDPKDPNALFRRAAAEGGEELLGATLSDMQALLNPVAGEAYLSYKNPTLQNKIFEQLRQGKMRWYDAVDLHGSSIEDARHAVQLLIHQAMTNGETVVKIVHGKGSDAIIKTCVNGWLRQIPDVMAFVSAPASDGGNGAVLVLLKRKKTSDLS